MAGVQNYTETNPNEIVIIQKLRAIDLKLNELSNSPNSNADTNDYTAIVEEEYFDTIDVVDNNDYEAIIQLEYNSETDAVIPLSSLTTIINNEYNL